MTAGQVALKDFLSKVEKACANAEPKEAKKGVCQQRKCKNVEKKCVVHTPAGTDFKKDELELRAIAPGDPCAAGDTNVLSVPKKKGKDVLFKCNCDCA